ncbi:MAG: glycosyltransferase family 1 protein [Candidatus Shapirobacteria bacterium]|jgi:glycosyltransferase involved in cell wall biosynthesis
MTGTKKINIAIDVSPLTNGNASRGVGYYTKSLIDHLQKETTGNPQYKNFVISYIQNPHISLSNFDLVHYPYFDIYSRTLPARQSIPTIVTVYDLIPRQFKAHYPPGIKGEINWLFQKHRLLQADLVITCSDYSKFQINRLTGYPLDRIYTVYAAPDTGFRVVSDPKLLKTIRQKYQLPPKFVLYVGDVNWNKNLPALVTTCLELHYPLVIVGKAAARENVINHIENSDLLWLRNQYSQLSQHSSPPLILTGFVPDDDLPVIYNLATIYCQPSFAEGFGMPLVQAMACGCPVIYSQHTSMPEIVDQNGLPFDPYKPLSLKTSLRRLWTNSTLRHHFARLGLERSHIFNWQKSALQTLAVYQLATT